MYKRIMLTELSKGQLYKDQCYLLPYPPYMYRNSRVAKELPVITVTSTDGETLFLHENQETLHEISSILFKRKLREYSEWQAMRP